MMTRKLFIILLCISLSSILSPALAETQRMKPKKLPVNEPSQLTFEPDPVLYTAVSRDGKWLVYASGREDFTDLWLRSADPALVVLPKKLTSDPASETSPAFSPDGKRIAYVGADYDAKGDIYLLNLDNQEEGSQRLTGRETEDGSPCFSPNGQTLYFHQSNVGEAARSVVALDVKSKECQPKRLNLQGDGAFPSISPDGSKLAFVTYRNDPGGDLFVLDLSSGKVSPLTKGPEKDLFPVWSPDGQWVYFSRFALDTNRDGAMTLKDHAVVYRVRSGDADLRAYPVTSASYSALQPQVQGEHLFFLSFRSGVSNVWSMPLDGEVPPRESVGEQMELAAEYSRQIPHDPYLTLLGYSKVLERFPREEPLAARAAYAIGKLYRQMDMPEMAEAAFQEIHQAHGQTQPEAALSLIDLTLIGIQRELNRADTDADKTAALNKGLSQLKSLSNESSGQPVVQARTTIEQARLLLDHGKGSDPLLQTVKLMDEVLEKFPSQREQAAEAMVLRADAYSKVGMSQEVYPAYLSVIERYSDVEEWADEAVERILNLTVGKIDAARLEDQVQPLREVAQANRESHPRLAMGALNRIGDLYFAADEWAKAKAAYRQVIEEFPSTAGTQIAAARLALAEILYKEERFREALDLYETEITSRPYEDQIYRLARMGYVRKSVAAGEFLYRIGEVASARKLFKDLMEYDASIVEAHRGYIKCAAAQKETGKVLSYYRDRLQKQPGDPVSLYAVGLCLTYTEKKDAMEEAQKLILRAVEQQGQVEYFHQTLGYTFEVLETVYGQDGNLELALESYQKAYFLNDHKNNPANAANLLLNLGNGNYLLGQYGKAFQCYSQRLESGEPFDHEDTEILFYQRFGASAFQVQETEAPIEAFQKTLELIDARIQPKRASELFDRINRYVMDRIVTPASQKSELAKRSKELAGKQSEINRKLFDLTQKELGPPPHPAWEAYKKAVESLLSEQKALFGPAASLAKALEKDAEEVQQTLLFMASGVEAALRAPQRLMQLRAEVLDRLGLAYQEAEQWKKATEAFEDVYALNQRLGLNQNLARNRRSIAYATYMQAERLSGEERERQLRKAAEDFTKAMDLVDKYGVPAKKKGKKGKGLIKLDLELSLDKMDSTEAAYGFSAEQEKRLAEAFIARIQTELGEVKPAQEALSKQLGEYSKDKDVSDKDVYGVSLLHHRAGHLAYTQGKFTEAFDAFRRSADFSLRTGNPVSAAINTANMAHVLTRLSAQDPELEQCRRQLVLMDQKTSSLLAKSSSVSGERITAVYHNALGVHGLSLPAGKSTHDLEAAAMKAGSLQQAAVHFSIGLDWLEKNGKKDDHQTLALLATLHLNLAEVSLRLGEDGTGREHLETALQLAQTGLLPELRWRTLARLGRFQEGLEALESVPILRAGCSPREITNAFSPLVADLVRANRTEEAFNLAERISELERVHRMIPLLAGDISAEDRDLYRGIYPRLQRIRELKRKGEEAPESEKVYLQEDLNRELELLASKVGKDRSQLPEFIRMAGSEPLQDQVMILLGLALHAEEVADSLVRTGERDENDPRLQEYRSLQEQYRQALDEMRAMKTEGEPPGMTAFLSPEPVEVIDLMENLPAGGTLVRLFQVQSFPKPRWIAFTVTPKEVKTSQLEASADGTVPASVIPHPASPTSGSFYLAFENLSALPPDTDATYALSATYLIRSIRNQKPFKRTFLAVGNEPTSEAHHSSLISHYSSLPLSDNATRQDLMETLPGVHTLLLDTPVFLSSSVPTRTEERPKLSVAMEMNQGQRVSLTLLSGRLSNASLAILPETSLNDAYSVGHLFSLFGCPTLLIPASPEAKQLPPSFLEAYRSASVADALRQAQSGKRAKERWLLLGYNGMSPAEARTFAEAHFEQYVQGAMAAFTGNKPLEALTLLENARTIALEVESFHNYLPDIYRYGRESAYAAGKLEKSLEFATALVDLMAQEQPDSQAHAEALLRLGLIQARLERFDSAVPTLEKAVEILTNLELAPEQVAALSDLGVVLENATEYDRALVQFETAAKVSQTLDKKELLAMQHRNIGRLYDLRLSQYARAKQSYEQALALYREISDQPGIAQSLLDIGRCQRLLGDFPAATERYREAMQLIESDPDSLRLKSKILIEQANNAWFQAKYQDAFDLQRAALELARENQWPLEQVISLNTSGLIWGTLGDYPRALRELEAALKMFDTPSQDSSLQVRRDEVATTLNNMGVMYREKGDYEEALKTFEKALAMDRELKSRWAIAYDLRNTALIYLRMDQPKKALPLLQEGLAEAQAIGDRVNEAKGWLGLGEAQLALDEETEAQGSFQKALELSRSMILRETQWRALYGLSRVHLKKDRKKEAREVLTQATAVIEEMRADIKIDQLKDGFIATKLAVYETLVGLLANMGEPLEAFDVAERSRARNFIDLLGNQRLNLENAIDQELYDRQKALKVRIEEHEALVAQATEEEEKTVYRQALNRINDEYRDLMLDIQAKNPQLASLVSVNPLKVSEVQALLEPGVALLAYYTLPQEILCWLVKGKSIELLRTPLGRETLDRSILDYRRMVQNLEPLEQQSKELSKWLLDPVSSRLESVQTLGIIPHGSLHYLSFATLSDGKSYLIDRFPLFYLPSASVLRYTLDRRRDDKNVQVLAIGNPNLGNPALNLPFAEQEVNSIRWNFPGITILTGEKATESWVAQHIAEFGIIHLASHGEFDPVNPLFSSVKLAKDESADGDLRAAEVFGLKINADLVLLSACQTGLGKVTSGDDVIGLNRSFFYAGTHAIVSSLWLVSDISTAVLVKQFYRQYVTQNKAQSLRRATLHVKNLYPHPGYWGAFILVGDYY